MNDRDNNIDINNNKNLIIPILLSTEHTILLQRHI